MRKVLMALLALAMLGAGSAFAQDVDVDVDVNLPEGDWAGVSIGFPGIGLHYGLDDFLGNDLDLRANVGIAFFGYLNVTVGADVLFEFDLADIDELKTYAGAGADVGFLSAGAVSGFSAGVNVLGGAEYRFDEFGVFGELEIGFGFGSVSYAGVSGGAFLLSPGGRVGFNYHF